MKRIHTALIAMLLGTALLSGCGSVSGLTREPAYRDVSFQVRRGEVLALAGLMGAGRTEVASALYGLQPADGG